MQGFLGTKTNHFVNKFPSGTFDIYYLLIVQLGPSQNLSANRDIFDMTNKMTKCHKNINFTGNHNFIFVSFYTNEKDKNL